MHLYTLEVFTKWKIYWYHSHMHSFLMAFLISRMHLIRSNLSEVSRVNLIDLSVYCWCLSLIELWPILPACAVILTEIVPVAWGVRPPVRAFMQCHLPCLWFIEQEVALSWPYLLIATRTTNQFFFILFLNIRLYPDLNLGLQDPLSPIF